MASIDPTVIDELLTKGPPRSLDIHKELTLAFAGLYLARTTLTARPKLVWEAEKDYYSRYYVPVESLHAEVKSHVLHSSQKSTDSSSKIRLEVVETLKNQAKDRKALVEKLTVGSRSTTWIRFLDGPLKDYVRFERSEIDEWFENGAIFAGIRNPYKRIETTPVARHIVIKVDGHVVAETKVAVLLSETYLKDVYYLPATSVKDWGMIEKSDHRTQCPYKGEAWYFHLTVAGKKHENAIWYYMYPTHESSGVEGFVAFIMRPNVELLVDGIDIRALIASAKAFTWAKQAVGVLQFRINDEFIFRACKLPDTY